jgi:hypothetical protein
LENNENLLRNREIEYYRKEIKRYEEQLAGYEKQATVTEIFKSYLVYFLGSGFISAVIVQLLNAFGISEDLQKIIFWVFLLVIFFAISKILDPFSLRSHYIGLIEDTENRIRDLYRKIRELES